MSCSYEFENFVHDMLEPMGPVAIRRMFGGAGVFLRGTMFALIADDVLYLKADAGNRDAFETLGCDPFVYQAGQGRVAEMSYYEMPPHLFDDPDELVEWARESLQIAEVAKAARPQPRRRRQALRR